jgi:xanthine/CO dehydrogenase XdhC/CoxF family maturation factor
MINEAEERGERVVVATVAHTRGSTAQVRKMLFLQNGEGGAPLVEGIEAEVWAEARGVCAQESPRFITFR